MTGARERWIWGIVLLAAVLRVVHIDAQPVGHHGWRQADTAAVARNFHEQGYRLFHPQIDWNVPGYVEMEFPLYPWVVSLAYGVLGEHIALARLLSAVASVVSVLFVFLLVRRVMGEKEALWAAGLWSILPLSIYFGRATMPESWMLAFSIVGVYQFSRWVERPSLTLLLSSATCISLACLLKPTSLYLGLPLVWLAWKRYGSAVVAQWQLWLFAAVITVPVVAWYWHAHWLGITFGATFGVFTGPSGKLGHWELLLDPSFYNRLFLEFFAARILTWFGFLLFLGGLLMPRRHPRERLLDVWLLGAIIMLLVGSGASSVHEYYALPLMIPAVAFSGRALTWIRPRSRALLAVLLIGLSATSLVRWTGFLRMERTEGSSSGKVVQDRRVAGVLSEHTAATDLVISCDDSNPTWLYLARRKGFGKTCDGMDKPAVAALERDGARYLVARHADFKSNPGSVLLQHLVSARTILHDDGEILLVDLTQPLRAPPVWRPLLLEAFDDDALPARWHFENGEWRQENGMLLGEPARRRLHARPEWTGCSICAITVTLSPTISPPGRRKASFSLTGWSANEAHVDITLDFARRRVRFEQTEGGRVLARASTTWPLVDGRKLTLDTWFDGFEFHVLLDGDLALTVANGAPEPPFGRLAVHGQNIRLAIDDLAVLGPSALDADPAAQASSPADQDFGEEPIDVALVWAGHPVGFALTTSDEFQYVGLYDAHRRMTIGQRRLPSTRWVFTTLPTSVRWDSHNGIALEVDRNGYVHVSGNMHGDRLVYFRSSRPRDISTFERPGMIGSLERKVTYPQFLTAPDGTLYYEYRHGKSGAGARIVNRYDTESKIWTRLMSTPLFDGLGESSAYLSGPVDGPDGSFHLVWMWRDTPYANTNHHVSYARSRDLEHWETVAGERLELPLTPRTMSALVDPVPTDQGLVGGGFGVGWDARSRPIISYLKYGPDGFTQSSNTRWENGKWIIRQTSSWNYRWDLERTGTLPWNIVVNPVTVDHQKRLTQTFNHLEDGRGIWILDETTLQPVARLDEPIFFQQLRQVKSTFPDMEVRPLIFDRQGQHFLRWETLPINRDRPRKPPFPPPSMLRVYKTPEKDSAHPETSSTDPDSPASHRAPDR